MIARSVGRDLGLVLGVVLALTGCTASERPEEALEAASVEGSIVIGDAFVLQGARLSVAPANVGAEGTRDRPVPLEDPPWTARTAALRDHWVLEARIAERALASGAGVHRIRLDWNGELAGEVYVEGVTGARPLGVVVRFDVGAALERSNVYAFEILRVP